MVSKIDVKDESIIPYKNKHIYFSLALCGVGIFNNYC
jgi:hypothetical protein